MCRLPEQQWAASSMSWVVGRGRNKPVDGDQHANATCAMSSVVGLLPGSLANVLVRGAWLLEEMEGGSMIDHHVEKTYGVRTILVGLIQSGYRRKALDDIADELSGR